MVEEKITNKLNFWSVHGIMNNVFEHLKVFCKVSFARDPECPRTDKIEFITYIYILYYQ